MAVGLLAVAVLSAAISGTPAHASDLRMAANNPVTLRACNHTKDTLLIAASFVPVGGKIWRNKGWMIVKAGTCDDIFVSANRKFYARAEVKDHSNQSWGNDIKKCIEYPGPYDFTTSSKDTSCPEGQPAYFAEFNSDGSAVYVWNLTP